MPLMRFLEPTEQTQGILQYCFNLQHKLTDCRAEVQRLKAPGRRSNMLAFLVGFAAGIGTMAVLLTAFGR